MNEKRLHKKTNGIYYTPEKLAEFVAYSAISSPDVKVLDPAYGEGALLLAARKRLYELGAKKPENKIFGLDIVVPRDKSIRNNLTKYICNDNLRKIDFFDLKESGQKEKYDIMLMNPPFVRHHSISLEYMDKIRRATGGVLKLSKASDLWSYFLIQSLRFLKKGGTIAAILPWSFMFADYSRKVRSLLSESFGSVSLIVVGTQLFDGAEERILVIMCKDYGKTTKEINHSYSLSIPENDQPLKKMSIKQWTESPWGSIQDIDVSQLLLRIADKYKFCSIKNYAKIKIGTVTGANGFFITKKSVAEGMSLKGNNIQPILRHSSQLCSLVTPPRNQINDFLLTIPENIKITGNLRHYIESGVEDGLHKGYHTSNRDIWYSIQRQKPPDGFLHYMTKEIPFISFNSDGLLSTNTIHNVFFKEGLDENTKKWIQLSMFSSISQLSIELLARTYGGGVLKMEPSAAKEILIYPGIGKRLPDMLRKEIDALLKRGKRKEVMEMVDKWFVSNSILTKEDLILIRNKYHKFRNIRLCANNNN